MPFRDRAPWCPRCRVDLERGDGGERFHCPRCTGLMLGAGELVEELLGVDPSLRDGIQIRDIRTIGRRSEQRLPCALCDVPMEPVFLGGAAIDRCRDDGVLWFDAGELEAVLAAASEQRDEKTTGLLRRLLKLVSG